MGALSGREADLVGDVGTKLLIGGSRRDATDGARFDVDDPSTGEVIASVADAGVDDGRAALAAAVAAQAGWAATPPRDRGEILRRAFALITERIDDLALLMTLEMGKTVAESKAEITYAAEFFRWFSEEAVRIAGRWSTAPNGATRLLTMRQPVGPCLFITPWNFPMAMGTRKIGPAVAAGCTMVVKPASATPLSMSALAGILAEAGLPDGVLNVVTTSQTGDVMEPLIRDPRLRKLSFTGSTQVGRRLVEQSSEQLLRVSMELGGNAPFVVFDDADLEAAVDGAMLAKMRNVGEACTAANRFLVHADVAEEFTSRLVGRMTALTVGRGSDEGVDVGLLGSTGSIGTQAIEVVRANPDRFRVVAVAAGGSDVGALAAQAAALGVEAVAVARPEAAEPLREALRAAGCAPEVLAGPDAATELAGRRCDVVLNGMTGSIGLRPTLAALEAGSTLALANKESLIVGGPLVTRAARPGQVVPVDSEHSALAQCLRGGRADEVARLVVTASGGPFRGWTRAQMADVTPDQALAHPTWRMGPVVTTNSATLVNKGLEVIEAHLLFGIGFDRIDVVVHPQSVVHSMVEFVDGSTLAQASPPDMRLPIALGLGWPDRVPAAASGCNWTRAAEWTFEPLDDEAFPAIRLARHVGQAGGTYPGVYNAANEECVAEFLAGRIAFLDIVDTVDRVVEDM